MHVCICASSQTIGVGLNSIDCYLYVGAAATQSVRQTLRVEYRLDLTLQKYYYGDPTTEAQDYLGGTFDVNGRRLGVTIPDLVPRQTLGSPNVWYRSSKAHAC